MAHKVQAYSYVNFVNEDSPELDETTIALKCEQEQIFLIDQLDAQSRVGNFINADAFYNAGERGTWSGGLSEVMYIKRNTSVPIELVNLIKEITGRDDIVIRYASIGRPDQYEWFSRFRKNDTYPDGEPQEITFRPTFLDKEVIFSGEAAYNYQEDSEIFLTTIDDESYVMKFISLENGKYKYQRSNDGGDLFDDFLYLDLPQEDEYYIVKWSVDGNDNTNTVILHYDGQYDYLEYLKDETSKQDLNAFPIIPLNEQGLYTNPFIRSDYQSQSGSSQGHTMIPLHERQQYIADNLDKYNDKKMLSGMMDMLNMNYDDITKSYLEGIKYPFKSISNQEEFNAKLTEYNDAYDKELTEDEALNIVRKCRKYFTELKGWNKADGENGNDIPISQEIKDDYKLHKPTEVPTDDENTLYLSIDNYVEQWSHNDIEEALKLTHNVYTSIGLNPYSKKYYVLNALFEQFNLYYDFFKNSAVTENIIRYEEQKYNKGIIFSSITKTTRVAAFFGGSSFRSPEFSSKIEGNTITVTRKIVNLEDQKIEYTDIKLYDFKFESLVQVDDHWGWMKTNLEDGKGKIAIPFIHKAYQQLDPIARDLVVNHQVFIETFNAKSVYIAWYATKGFLEFIKVAVYIGELIYTMVTLGGGSINAQVIGNVLMSAIENALISKALEYGFSRLSPELREALMFLYTVYELQSKDFSGSKDKALAYLNATSELYEYHQKLEIEDLKSDLEENQEEIDLIKEDIEDRMGKKINIDDNYLQSHPVTPKKMLETLNVRKTLYLDHSVDGFIQNTIRNNTIL